MSHRSCARWKSAALFKLPGKTCSSYELGSSKYRVSIPNLAPLPPAACSPSTIWSNVVCLAFIDLSQKKKLLEGLFVSVTNICEFWEKCVWRILCRELALYHRQEEHRNNRTTAKITLFKLMLPRNSGKQGLSSSHVRPNPLPFSPAPLSYLYTYRD